MEDTIKRYNPTWLTRNETIGKKGLSAKMGLRNTNLEKPMNTNPNTIFRHLPLFPAIKYPNPTTTDINNNTARYVADPA
jgi:hypothetical protein